MALQEQEMSYAVSWKRGMSHTKNPADDGIVCVHAYMSSCSCCNKRYEAKFDWVKCKDFTRFI